MWATTTTEYTERSTTKKTPGFLYKYIYIYKCEGKRNLRHRKLQSFFPSFCSFESVFFIRIPCTYIKCAKSRVAVQLRTALKQEFCANRNPFWSFASLSKPTKFNNPPNCIQFNTKLYTKLFKSYVNIKSNSCVYCSTNQQMLRKLYKNLKVFSIIKVNAFRVN